MNLNDAIDGKLDAELNAVFQEAFEPRAFVIYKPIYGDWGYYRAKGAGYTTRDRAWRVTEQEGAEYVSGRKTDSDRVILQPAPQLDYINAMESLGLIHKAEKTLTPLQFRSYLKNLACQFTDHPDDGYIRAVTANACRRVISLLQTVKPEVFTC